MIWYGKRSIVQPAVIAPASAAASSSNGISWSFRPGMIGEVITPTGMPASRSSRTARSRSFGEDARGSIIDASFVSSVVTLRNTRAALTFASGASRSMSRVTR